MRFIDVSGVGNTGKSAVVDLLREVDGLWMPEYWFEFDLLRVPGGLLDLRHALVEDWSPIRSDAAWHRFRDVVEKMGGDPRPWNLGGLLRSTSQRYDRRFARRFRALALAFADSFVTGTYRSEWPYAAFAEHDIARAGRKLLRRAGLRRSATYTVRLIDGTGFDARVQAFLADLYSAIVPPETEAVVLNNGFEPFHPQPALTMLAGARQVVVTRDPRDVYVSGLNAHRVAAADRSLIAFDNDGMNKSFLGADDLAVFVARFRRYHAELGGEDPRVLKVAFEDLARAPQAWIPGILAFLDIDPARHVRPGQTFAPQRSAANVGLWRTYSRTDEIAYLERELGPWLYHG